MDWGLDSQGSRPTIRARHPLFHERSPPAVRVRFTPSVISLEGTAVSDPKNPDTVDPHHEEDLDIVTKRKVERPPLYRVVFHNDDYTTRDFVVMVLMRFFHKSHSEATTVMLHVHTKGAGTAGVYPLDIARTKVAIVEKLAREHDMPLKLSIEPDD